VISEPKDFLARALSASRARLTEAETEIPLSTLDEKIWTMHPVRSLEAALRGAERLHVIAEMKRSSPSAGLLRPTYEPSAIAAVYRDGGASAVSVLTEPDHFGGDLAHLHLAREAGLPVLRKDFLVSPYQVAEARVAGADAVLLIVAALGEVGLRQMLQARMRYGMSAIVEVHDEEDVEVAADCGARIIGVNCRDLHTLTVDPERCFRLAELLPKDCIKVAESGVVGPEQVKALRAARYDAVLVGESLLRAADPRGLLEEMVAAGRL
jgi:indole-3-glycerol phosphate synthase